MRRSLGALLLLLLAGSASAAPQDPPAAGGECAPPRLRWTVRHPEEIYGFLIYRATAREGPYVRVNREIVRLTEGTAREDGLLAFAWEDPQAPRAGRLFYYVDLLTRGGEKRRLSGVVEKSPCAP